MRLVAQFAFTFFLVSLGLAHATAPIIELDVRSSKDRAAAGLNTHLPKPAAINSVLAEAKIRREDCPKGQEWDPPLLYLRAGTFPISDLRLLYPWISAGRLINLRRNVLAREIALTDRERKAGSR